jgi:hypothetical protein
MHETRRSRHAMPEARETDRKAKKKPGKTMREKRAANRVKSE